MSEERLSVRGLVEFTLHGEDITPAGSLRDMQEGMLGHKARQACLGSGWEAEVPLKLTLPLDDGESTLVIAGRMDAFRDGETPVVEEIKLWQAGDPPEEPMAAHRMQAVVYAHILCVTRGTETVEIQVAYVTRSGIVRALFPETLCAAECREQFEQLLRPWLRRREWLKDHARLRDAALRDLRFPYETWRPGQREMAAQCYTAIRRGKRLFASMPTGTGKSAAALYPALKALGEGYSDKVFYLTARTTQRQGPLDALARMREQPFHLWTLVLDAKERQCPQRPVRCSPETCPRAKGHFLRDAEAIEELMRAEDWTPEAIAEAAERHQLCPFELSLSLCELADLVICDYNYALDPAVHIQRVFDRGVPVTLLIDEAHNLQDRVREMLSGRVDGKAARRLRTETGRRLGRKHSFYKALTQLLRALTDLPVPEEEPEGILEEIPQSLTDSVAAVTDAWLDSQKEGVWLDGMVEFAGDLLRFQRAQRDGLAEFAVLWEGRRDRTVTLQALGIGDYFASVTQPACGTVCFSATLHPLEDTKALLGGEAEDACFAAPSPFPAENLLVLRRRINTRYAGRERSAAQIADEIAAMVRAHSGRHIAFFPSYAYMHLVSEKLTVPFVMQTPGMSIAERDAFLRPFREKTEDCLALCVLGGVFAEGIDLPGECLDGVAIVGIGLPQVGVFRESLRKWHEDAGRNGFRYAYELPGMQRVAQAVGRVIRTGTDRGVALLLDDRYFRADVAELFPPHWRIRDGDTESELKAFWNQDKSEESHETSHSL